MDTQANKERKFTQAMEKWIMYFMYALFGGLFFLISLQGSWSREGTIVTMYSFDTLNNGVINHAQGKVDLFAGTLKFEVFEVN